MASPARDAAAVPGLATPARGERDAPAPPPLDPRRVSLDVFELYCQAMLATELADVGTRDRLVTHLQYLMRRLIRRQHDFGRLYNRTILTNIVARVCGRHAYAPAGGAGGAPARRCDGCLVEFAPDKWAGTVRQFRTLRECLLRRDAALLVLPQPHRVEGGTERAGVGDDDDEDEDDDDDDESVPEPDDGINDALASHPDFSKHYTDLLHWMKFHLCLSHLAPLSAAVHAAAAEAVVIPRDDVHAFEAAIEEEFGDVAESPHAGALSELRDALHGEAALSAGGGLRVPSDGDGARVYAAHADLFGLARLQHAFLALVRRWAARALPAPALSRLGYGAAVARGPAATARREDAHPSPASGQGTHDDVEAFSSDEAEEGEPVRDLKRKRAHLQKIVKDPLDHCVAVAQSARTQPEGDPLKSTADASHAEESAAKAPSLRQKKKSARQTSPFSSDASHETEAAGRAGAEEASQAAESAAKAPSFRQKKTSAHQETFSSDESHATAEAGRALSGVPARYRPARRAPSPPAFRAARKHAPARKRVKFSAEEDQAIREGIAVRGFGDWIGIKAQYCVQLSNRTTVQIKDRARTLGITC